MSEETPIWKPSEYEKKVQERLRKILLENGPATDPQPAPVETPVETPVDGM